MIEVQGRTKHKKLVEDYILNLVKELGIDQRRKWSLTVSFKSRVEDDCMGVCIDDPDKDFDIELARIVSTGRVNFYEQMQTLAHEMVHVKQFFEGVYPSEREAKTLEYGLFAKCFPWSELP
jgi:hypothetical protein